MIESTQARVVAAASCGQTWNWVIGSPGQWVIWVTFLVGSPGQRVIILTPCETRVFPVFEKNYNYGTDIAVPGTMQILLFGAGYKYSYLLTYLVDYSSTRQDTR